MTGRPKLKKHRLSMEKRNGLYGWFFVSPFVIGLLFVYLSVIYDSIKFSFSKIQITAFGYDLINVKFDNYKYAFKVDPDFVKDLVEVCGSFLLETTVIIFFSLFISVILNQGMKGQGFFRAIFLLPVILSTGIVAKAEISNSVMTNYQALSGISTGSTVVAGGMTDIASTLQNLYISSSVIEFITKLIDSIYDIVNYSGVQIILFLSGLQAISPSVYEAAHIEGASGWECFWKLVLPMMCPIIFVNTVYTAVDIFTRSNNPVMMLISNTMFDKTNYGAASAMAWVYFGMIAFLLALVALFFRKIIKTE